MLLFGFMPGTRPGSFLKCFGIALCLLCLTTEAQVQETTQPVQSGNQQAPTLSVTAREVLLDVVVNDSSGNPVTGLGVSDFTVTEEGEPQRLTHVEEHHSMGATDMARPTAAPAFRLTRSADGVHHGTVEFVTVVYDQAGNMVNSQSSSAVLHLSDAHYRQMLERGLPVRQEIAVPVKGNYFLRVGVHDIASDHIGTLEMPADEVREDVSGHDLLKP